MQACSAAASAPVFKVGSERCACLNTYCTFLFFSWHFLIDIRASGIGSLNLDILAVYLNIEPSVVRVQL